MVQGQLERPLEQPTQVPLLLAGENGSYFTRLTTVLKFAKKRGRKVSPKKPS